MSEKKTSTCLTICPWCQKRYKVLSELVGKSLSCKACSKAFEIQPWKPPPQIPDICKVALFEKMLNKKQVNNSLAAFKLLKRAGTSFSFDEFFLWCGLFTFDQKRIINEKMKLIKLRQLGNRFCSIALKKGFITQKDADDVLARQAQQLKEHQTMELIGDILVNEGMITPEQREVVLVQQKRVSAALTPGDVPSQSGEDPDSQQDIPGHHHDIECEDVPSTTTPAGVEQSETVAAGQVQSEKGGVKEEEEGEEEGEEDKEGGQDAVNVQKEGGEKHGDDDHDQRSGPAGDLPFEIVVTDDGVEAILRIKNELDDPITLDEIKDEILKAQVIYGVVEDAVIEGFLNLAVEVKSDGEPSEDQGEGRDDPESGGGKIQDESDKYQELTIARGVPAQKGKSAVVNYFFDTDYLKIGAKKEDGSIDFMDRGEIPFVSKGDMLAEKTPVQWPEPGIDVHGFTIEAPAVSDIPLRCGKGADFTEEDKLKVVAKNDGEPRVTFDGMLTVLMERRIAGNIGLKTGHVEFEGNITVSGIVRSGFHVKCAGLEAATIEEADIETTGDVIVAGGITGATIRSQGRVVAKYISKSSIHAYGDVIAEKEIIESRIQTSGGCLTRNGSVISSEILAKLGIESGGDIGTETSTPCVLHVGGDEHLEQELDLIRNEIHEQKKRMEDNLKKRNLLEQENNELEQKLVSLAHIQDRGQLEIAGLKKNLEKLISLKKVPQDQTASLAESGKGAELLQPEKEIEKIANEIRNLTDKVANADNEVNTLFQRQDSIQENIEKADEEYADAESTIGILKFKRESLIKVFKKQRGVGLVKACKSIFSGTVIAGNHVKKMVENTLRNVTLRERKVTKSDSSAGEWDITIQKN